MATYYKGDGTQITIPDVGSVNTAQLVDNAVTYNKLAEAVQDQLGTSTETEERLDDIEAQIDELAEAIESVDIETDTTLSVSGIPADAKAVGDALNNIDVDAQIAQYIDEHNIEGVTDEEVQAMVDSYLAESMGESVADYLDAHPELTTTVQDGSITVAKLANEVVSKIEDGGEKMATTVPVGKLFDTGYVYSSWVHNNVKYDAINDVICVMVNNSDSHASATYRDVILYKLSPRTLKVEDIIEVNKSATSGEQFEVYGFEILSNGTYMFLPCYDTAVSSSSSNKLMMWASSDYGETWTSTEATVTSLTSQSAYEWFGLTQLSSGMLVCTEYKTKSILHSSDNGTTWIAQAMGNSTHEPTFIDCGNDKIICYCRKTMYGTSNGAWNGTKQIEPAVYHTSTDGGGTWTYKGNSASITEMTACNCACAISDGYADLYVCSRMPHGDAYGVIYHHFASLDDVFNDSWNTAKVVTYPSTPSASDFGYIGATVDSVGTQHIFYYDTDTVDKAEVRYIMASRSGVPMPVNSDISEVLTIPYSREKTDALLSSISSQMLAYYNELLLKIGELPDSGDDPTDPTYWISDGLQALYVFNESYYDSTSETFAPVYVASQTYSDAVFEVMAGDYSTSGNHLGSYSTRNTKSFATAMKSLIEDAVLNSTSGYTIEVDWIPDESGFVTNSNTLLSVGKFKFISYSALRLFEYSESSANTSNVLSSVNLRTQLNGTSSGVMTSPHTLSIVYDRANDVTTIYADGIAIMDSTTATLTSGYTLDIGTANTTLTAGDYNAYLALFGVAKYSFRVYNKPLTANEVLSNYNYSMNTISEL